MSPARHQGVNPSSSSPVTGWPEATPLLSRDGAQRAPETSPAGRAEVRTEPMRPGRPPDLGLPVPAAAEARDSAVLCWRPRDSPTPTVRIWANWTPGTVLGHSSPGAGPLPGEPSPCPCPPPPGPPPGRLCPPLPLLLSLQGLPLRSGASPRQPVCPEVWDTTAVGKLESWSRERAVGTLCGPELSQVLLLRGLGPELPGNMEVDVP